MVNHVFDQGKTTLAHLACALGSNEIVSVLMRRGGSGSNTIWTQKDDDGKSLCGERGRERKRERREERGEGERFQIKVTLYYVH